MVEVAKEHVTAGDIFQVVLSQRFDIEGSVDPFAVYRALRLVNPSPYLYFLRTAGVEVAGSSPEPMVRLRDGVVTSRPIAGSRPRGETAAEDDRLAGELSEDPKEVAEHIMLVDLARNDVGRVAALRHRAGRGAHDGRALQPRHAPHQPGRGELRRGARGRRRAAGHAAGRHALGRARRSGPWRSSTSSSPPAAASTAASSATSTSPGTSTPPSPSAPWSSPPDGRASVQAGAGIVADSDPQSEELECRSKAAAVLAAVAVAARVEGA